MAKRAVGGKAGGRGARSRGPLIVLILVGFVLVASGVNLRRVYGFRQDRLIGVMKQRREFLTSEQQKIQDAIRVASNRSHLIDIAQSRLGMKMPELNQVIDLPRRPLVRGRDSLRP